MFRSKKGSSQILEPASAHKTDDADIDEAEIAKSLPRRPLPAPVRAYAASTPSYEVSRRAIEPPVAVGRSAASGTPVREKTLTVGRDAHLRGEVVACERLVVEGRLDVTVHACHHVLVGESGVFRGTFDVAEADIAGDLEGEITVRERLTVRATGKIRGRIRYRHIVIEAGGLIVGDVGELDNGKGRGTVGDEAPRNAEESPARGTHAPAFDSETMIAPLD